MVVQVNGKLRAPYRRAGRCAARLRCAERRSPTRACRGSLPARPCGAMIHVPDKLSTWWCERSRSASAPHARPASQRQLLVAGCGFHLQGHTPLPVAGEPRTSRPRTGRAISCRACAGAARRTARTSTPDRRQGVRDRQHPQGQRSRGASLGVGAQPAERVRGHLHGEASRSPPATRSCSRPRTCRRPALTASTSRSCSPRSTRRTSAQAMAHDLADVVMRRLARL